MYLSFVISERESLIVFHLKVCIFIIEGDKMKQFTLGPVEMYERTKAVGALPNIYFRTPEFSSFMKETDELLRRFFSVSSEYHTIIMASSGTGAMEATLHNCFTHKDKMLIIKGGKFATYFINMCEYQSIPFDTIDIPFGDALTTELLAPFEKKGYTALLVNIHETSTGQLYDKQMLRNFCMRNNMYFIVDAISSIVADEVNLSKCSMDAVIFSSQKGLALAPGLGIIILGDKIYNERVKDNKTTSLYFDFKQYIKNMERFQTPFTPAINILYQLNDMLKYLLEQGGAMQMAEKTNRLAEYFRQKAKQMGFKALSFPTSNALTPLYFTDISAFDIHTILKEKYDIMVNPSGLLPENLLPVGHFGNLSKSDYDTLLSAMTAVCEGLKNG